MWSVNFEIWNKFDSTERCFCCSSGDHGVCDEKQVIVIEQRQRTVKGLFINNINNRNKHVIALTRCPLRLKEILPSQPDTTFPS